MEKKKVTKNILGNVFHKLQIYLSKMPKDGRPRIDGVIFSNKGAMGREPILDASLNETKDIMVYWHDSEKHIFEVTAVDPGYEIKTPKDMNSYFAYFNSRLMKLKYLDVTHLDVSQTQNFKCCFWGFGQGGESQLVGVETWDVSNGQKFSNMFYACFYKNERINLDLTSWNFLKDKCKDFSSMFEAFGYKAKEVRLNLSGWNVEMSESMSSMFREFAPEATSVVLEGVENWQVPTLNCDYDYMFFSFSPMSGCCLNLEAWSQNFPLEIVEHHQFAENTFFRIKQPRWVLPNEYC